MFSPYYAKARERGPVDPERHVAINVALYGGASARWAMTERDRKELSRSENAYVLGPSALAWDGEGLTIDLDERNVPFPSLVYGAVRGRVRLIPETAGDFSMALDPAGRHHWRPIAPRARVEVEFRKPELNWTGTGYFDHNIGVEPLEDGFSTWTWARGALPEGAAVVYGVTRRDGSTDAMALRFRPDGSVERAEAPPRSDLAITGWKVGREVHSEAGSKPRLLVTYEDTPFYARSLVEATLFGHEVSCFHESLSLDRFRRPEVRFLLPFRMPRVVDGVRASRLMQWTWGTARG